jgi:LuxR family maltose regulon positive regulatory protein
MAAEHLVQMPQSSSSRRGPPPPPFDALPAVAGTKLAPPRAGGRLIAREPLLARLLEARRQRCIVLTGPAGCGKTSLLASWRLGLLPLGFDVAWLSLTPEDNELARFLDGLVASLAQVDPAIVREAALLGGGSIDADAAERVAVSLVRGIAAHPRELVLVLDDLHHLSDPAIHEALQWLLDYAPPKLHLVLASRSTLRLSLDRLRGRGQTLELGPRDLRFSPDESAQFLKAQLGDLDQRTIKSLHDLTDGWVAGLQLVSIDWKHKHPELARAASDAAFPRVPLRDAHAFTRYFEHEVLSGLSPAQLDALVCVAPCSRFCASLCAALTGQPGAVAVALLARLENDNLFVVPADSREPETWYRLHPLLRETLLARFSALDETRQREVHARAWLWFRDHGPLDEAVRHAVQAGEAALAAGLVEQCALSLFVRGERRTLISLLRQLPAEQVERSFVLRVWLTRSQLYLRELDACEKSLQRLEHDVAADDAGRRFQLAMLRATLCVQRDDTDGALALLPQLINPPPGVDALALGGRNNILSWLYMHQGDFEKARRIQLEAPKLLVDGVPLVSTAGGSLQGRCLMGLSYALEGQMTHAERIYRAVAAEAEQGGKACVDTYYLAIALLGDVLYELNETQQARALLESKADVLERITIPDAVLRVLRLLSAANWQAGNRLESFAYLERLEDYAVKHGLDRLLAYSLADSVQRRLLQGDVMAAEADLARLNAVDARHPHVTQGALSEINEIAERTRISVDVAEGRLDAAAVRLADLIALCEARGRRRVAVHLLVRSAAVDARRARVQAARGKLLAALQRGHRLGLLRSLLDADPMARKMIRELAQTEALDPVLAFYVERLESSHARTPSAATPVAAPAGSREIEAFSEREIAVLRLLALAMPNKKIARALNLSPETVKWYLSRIYGKLRVAGRDEAVACVRDLGLGG